MRISYGPVPRPTTGTKWGWGGINQYPVSFDSLPYGMTMNNTLLSGVDLPGNFCALGGGLGGGGAA